MKRLILWTLLIVVNHQLVYSIQNCPCCEPQYRQFDFWVGQWEVFNKEGKLIGTNTIKILQDSCILQENWRSLQSDYSGTSYNFYSTHSNKWHQVWIDNKGQNLDLSGAFNGKQMVLEGSRRKDKDGKEYINKITWTPLEQNKVHQLWEISYDEGKTWKMIFDGEYRKTNE